MKKKNILLLGGYGFIGTNILSYIDKKLLPYNVIVVDRNEHHPMNLHFNCIIKSYANDWSNESFIKEVFQSNEIDIVMHSISATIPSLSNSARYDVEANLLPTISVLDAMRENNCRNIVFISSGGAIYSESTMLHSENADVFPKSTYGVTKLAIEKFIFQYAIQYAMRPLILRLSNPYGKYHTSMRQGIINVAMRRAKNNEPIHVWGNGNASKDYIYIEDFCEVLFSLLEKNVYGEVINVGSGHTYTINQILLNIKKYFPNIVWIYDKSNSRDTSTVRLSTEKMNKYIHLNFRRLEDILPELI